MPWIINPFDGELVYADKISRPPDGKHKVINIFVDPSSGKFVVEYDDGEEV